MKLNITSQKEGSTLLMALDGSLDTQSSPEMVKELDSNLDGVKELICDFDRLTYVSSTGLRAILESLRKMEEKGTMKIINVPEVVMEVFEITGLSENLNIESVQKG